MVWRVCARWKRVPFLVIHLLVEWMLKLVVVMDVVVDLVSYVFLPSAVAAALTTYSLSNTNVPTHFTGGRGGGHGGRGGRGGGSGGGYGGMGGRGGEPGEPGGMGGRAGEPGEPGGMGGRAGEPGEPGGMGGRAGEPGEPGGMGGRAGGGGGGKYYFCDLCIDHKVALSCFVTSSLFGLNPGGGGGGDGDYYMEEE